MPPKKVEELAPAGPPQEAPGVCYEPHALAPGLKMFRCEPYRATLSTKTCAARWIKGQGYSGNPWGDFHTCSKCTIGACHAGYGVVTYSGWYKAAVCARCGRGATRMIANRLCVSCYNRAREMRIGKNGRGTAPVQLLQNPLRAIEVMLEVDGEVRRLVDRETSGLAETMVQFLRTNTGEISFSRASGAVQPAEAVVDGGVAEVEAGTLWAISDARCAGCGGRILLNEAGVSRCADCGGLGEGRRRTTVEGDRVDGRAPRGAADLFRARLLASTVLGSHHHSTPPCHIMVRSLGGGSG